MDGGQSSELLMRGGTLRGAHLHQEGARETGKEQRAEISMLQRSIRRAGGRTAGSSPSHVLAILILVLLSSVADSQSSDTTPPDVSAVSVTLGSIIPNGDISVSVDTSMCSLASCGNPWDSDECVDEACFVRPVFAVSVSDLSSDPENEPNESGVSRLSLRFAKPSAAIAGASTQTTPDDADVDPAHFTVVTQEVAQSGTRVGTSAANSPQFLSLTTTLLNGYSQPGTWQLDSLLIRDQELNERLLSKSDLLQRGISVSFQVTSMIAGECSGTCSDSNVAGGSSSERCLLYRGGAAEAWWKCESTGGSSQPSSSPGVCCSSCAAAPGHNPLSGSSRALCELDANGDSSSRVLPMPSCGCYRGNATTAWSCSFTPNNEQRQWSVCGGGQGTCASIGGSESTCGVRGSVSSGPGAEPQPAVVPGGEGAGVGGINGSGGSNGNSSNSSSTIAGGVDGGEKGGEGGGREEGGESRGGEDADPGRSSFMWSELGWALAAMGAFGSLGIVALIRYWKRRRDFEHWHEQHHYGQHAPVLPVGSGHNATIATAAQLMRGGRVSSVMPLAERAEHGQRFEQSLQVLQEMGFERQDSIAALNENGGRVTEAAMMMLSNTLGWQQEQEDRDRRPPRNPPIWHLGAGVVYPSLGDVGRQGGQRRVMHDGWVGGERGEGMGGRGEGGVAEGGRLGGGVHVSGAPLSASGVAEGGRLGGGVHVSGAPLSASEQRRQGRAIRNAWAKTQRPLPLSVSGGGGRGGGDDLGGECCVCMDAPIQARLIPCGHADMCVKCATAVFSAGQPCPICRTSVENFTTVESPKF